MEFLSFSPPEKDGQRRSLPVLTSMQSTSLQGLRGYSVLLASRKFIM